MPNPPADRRCRDAAGPGQATCLADKGPCQQSISTSSTTTECDRRHYRVTHADWPLSGGGIRSAAVCLGALQALFTHERISSIDYLSTVSGGGYIGSGLTGAMIPQGGGQFPFGGDIFDNEVISHLRNYSNYLLPRGRTPGSEWGRGDCRHSARPSRQLPCCLYNVNSLLPHHETGLPQYRIITARQLPDKAFKRARFGQHVCYALSGDPGLVRRVDTCAALVGYLKFLSVNGAQIERHNGTRPAGCPMAADPDYPVRIS